MKLATLKVVGASIVAVLLATLGVSEMSEGSFWVIHDPGGKEQISLFDPHRSDFSCSVEAGTVPPVDAQAHTWFLEALTFEDRSIWIEQRDYKKIVELTRDAAERRHWKAMLNLASLYLEERDSAKGESDALALVVEGTRLGVPAAYDRLGTFYKNGTGLKGDATKAFAFWQRAADMGNPQAMVHLGEMLAATWNDPKEGFWANIPVAIKMLECALAQGYGEAAYHLADLYGWEYSADWKDALRRTVATKGKSLRALHHGVRLGCEECASQLLGIPAQRDRPFRPNVTADSGPS